MCVWGKIRCIINVEVIKKPHQHHEIWVKEEETNCQETIDKLVVNSCNKRNEYAPLQNLFFYCVMNNNYNK